jgi:hypothetical protein
VDPKPLTRTLAGESSVAALLGEVIAMLPADSRGFLAFADRGIAALMNIGGTAAA